MKKINILISTFFGYGYLTKIPGTVTSLVTAIFIYIAYEYLGYNDLKFSLILLLYLNQTNQLSLPIEIYYVLSFIFFRFFDILKPFPVSYFDKNFKNYFGIIMDDIMAGLYSMLAIYLISLKF